MSCRSSSESSRLLDMPSSMPPLVAAIASNSVQHTNSDENEQW